MKRSLIAASALALAACATPQTDTQTTTTAAAPTAAIDTSAGQQVYATFCGACHNGGDETAPVLDVLHTLGKEARLGRPLPQRA